MDILSYSTAKKAKKKLDTTEKDIGSDAKSTFSTIKERVDHLEEKIQEAWRINDEVRLKTYLGRIALEKKKILINLATEEDLEKLFFSSMKDARAFDLTKSEKYLHDPITQTFNILPGGKLVTRKITFNGPLERIYFDLDLNDPDENVEIFIDGFINGDPVFRREAKNKKLHKFNKEYSPHQIEISIESKTLSQEEIENNIEREDLDISSLAIIWSEYPKEEEDLEGGEEDNGDHTTEEPEGPIQEEN